LIDQLNALAANGAKPEDLRQLADDCAHIDQQLAEKVNNIVTAVNATLATADSSILVDDSTLYQAEDNVKQTLAHLSEALVHYRTDVEVLRNNAEQVRSEINNVLVAFQFQDRVSQILTQVENNLLNLQKTIQKIQQQGSERNGNMLQVDEAVEHIEENYKSVSSRPSSEQDSSDDLTFF
jgi:methyl-accepting chemotaxis protein